MYSYSICRPALTLYYVDIEHDFLARTFSLQPWLFAICNGSHDGHNPTWLKVKWTTRISKRLCDVSNNWFRLGIGCCHSFQIHCYSPFILIPNLHVHPTMPIIAALLVVQVSVAVHNLQVDYTWWTLSPPALSPPQQAYTCTFGRPSSHQEDHSSEVSLCTVAQSTTGYLKGISRVKRYI